MFNFAFPPWVVEAIDEEICEQSKQGISDDSDEGLLHPEAVRFDGLEDALIGVGGQYTKANVLVYSASKILDVLMARDEMSYEDACEFFEFNIACLWAGEGTPIIVYDVMGDGI